MHNIKELLRNLQDVDEEIVRIENDLIEIPEKIKKLEEKIKDENQNLQQAEEGIKDLKKNEKLKELSLQETEEKIAKLSTQLYSAKTNEEYKAFLREIEFAKQEKRKIEDEILELMEEIEEKEKKLPEVKKKIEENIKKLKDEKEKENKRIKELEGKIKELTETRGRILKEIPEQYVKIYEKIRKNKEGIAVARVTEDNRCSVCLNPVPLQKVIEIKNQQNKLFFCEYCGRILID